MKPPHTRSNMRRIFTSTSCLLWIGLCLFSRALAHQEAKEYRSFDGQRNNRASRLGAANAPLLRKVAADRTYVGSAGYPLARDNVRPGPRYVSNNIAQFQPEFRNKRKFNDLVNSFAQFIRRDLLMVTDVGLPSTVSAGMVVPTCDKIFDRWCQGGKFIAYNRTAVDGEVTNKVSAFLDLSTVYGDSSATAGSLREYNGGRLVVHADVNYGPLLPIEGVDIFASPRMKNPRNERAFAAGDIRANDLPLLTILHTIFVREHNRIAAYLGKRHSTWSEETIFQEARRRNIAYYQQIVYHEFLPLIFGKDILGPYSAYNPNLDPGIDIGFATSGFQYFISEISEVLQRLDERGISTKGHVLLRDCFYKPSVVLTSGLEVLLRGAVRQAQHETDVSVADDFRNFYGQTDSNAGSDQFAFVLQQGRDHGLASLNDYRQSSGLLPYSDFDALLPNDVGLAAKLKTLYSQNITLLDLFVGGLVEPKLGGSFGSTFESILKDQFLRLRDGDRFWFESSQNEFDEEDMADINYVKFSHVITRNTKYQPTDRIWFVQDGIVANVLDDKDLANLQTGFEHSVQLSPSFLLQWTVSPTKESIYFRVAAKTTGWVGIGFGGDDFGMNGMDIVLGYVDSSNGMAVVQDCHANGKAAPIPDTSVNIDDIAGRETSNGVTIIQFTRQLNSPDNQDHDINIAGKTRVSWAWGETDAMYHHGANAGSHGVDFSGNATSDTVTVQTDAGGYSTQVLSPSFLLAWRVSNDSIYIRLDFPVVSWIGFGLGDEGKGMAHADIALISVVDNSVEDYYSWHNTFPMRDLDMGGQSNVELISLKQTGNSTVVELKRPILAKDIYDRNIEQTYNTVIYAWGTGNYVHYHGAVNTGTAKVSFLKVKTPSLGEVGLTQTEGQCIDSTLTNHRAIHGVLMVAAWPVIATGGILVGQYGKHAPWGKPLHRLLMGVVVFLTFGSFIHAIVTENGIKLLSTHARIGMSVVSGCLVQAILGLCMWLLPETNASFPRIQKIHRKLGMALWILSQVATLLGLLVFEAGDFFYAFHLSWAISSLLCITLYHFNAEDTDFPGILRPLLAKRTSLVIPRLN